MQKLRFAHANSVYLHAPEDPAAPVLSTSGLIPDDRGVVDITQRLSRLLDSVKTKEKRGIVFLPEGEYSISSTVYIPRAIRLIGFGSKRPRIRLKSNTPGFQIPPPGDKGQAAYMFWFTGNSPLSQKKVEDANPGTFYSAISNIDFLIEPGNPAAVVMRTHFAQHSFVSHCVFDIGQGKAGVFDVGNEMENLVFYGGEYGIYTTKCSPGWPFVLVNSGFFSQRSAAVHSRECGLTFSHTEFQNVPAVLTVENGTWEKVFWKDCVLENITSPAFQISREDNSCTQLNLRNLWCRNVPRLLLQSESGKVLNAPEPAYRVISLCHGDSLSLGEQEPVHQTALHKEELHTFCPDIAPEIPPLPSQNTWVSVHAYGAMGDGHTDDTLAIQQALAENDTVYLPQGRYMVTDTVRMKPGNALVGLNPISTQLALPENAPAFAGLGGPKALLETARGGHNLLNGIGLDTGARNPRAVGCQWMAGPSSYMNDVKFVGGHGQLTSTQENVPVYNPSRTADYDPTRPWDCQYWSLWITENGGGVFKDIWSASPHALAGIFLSETQSPGVMYQVSVEHHVRHEILLRNVSNWQFYAMQTEEEVAESSRCQPFELSGCHNLLFANFYAFRVIWVDNPYPQVVRAWDCDNLEFLNCHNFTQMKYTIDNLYLDCNTGLAVGQWQLASLKIPSGEPVSAPALTGTDPILIQEHLDAADSLCEDSQGNLYVLDSRLARIYRRDAKSGRVALLTVLPNRPLSLYVDRQDRLALVMEYRPVPKSLEKGLPELETNDFPGQDSGGCYYPFFSLDRRVRVCTCDPAQPELSLLDIPALPVVQIAPQALLFPTNQWRDNGDMMDSFQEKHLLCHPLADGVTAVVHHPALSRATGLTPLRPGETAYLVDEYNKCVISAEVRQDFSFSSPTICCQRGEYSVEIDSQGILYVPDALLYLFRQGKKLKSISLPHRPANVALSHLYPGRLWISARQALYLLPSGASE